MPVQRQRDERLETAAFTRTKLQRAAVQTRDALDDRKPETCAARMRPCVRAAAERRLEFFHFCGVDSAAAIADGDTRSIAFGPCAHGEARTSIRNRVVHQI